MDPLSIVVSATALIGVCFQTVQLIRRIVETVKNAGTLLIKLLSQTESLRLILEQLRGHTKQLGTKAGILLSFDDSGPNATINELRSLFESINGKKKFIPLQMLLNKGKVDALVERMKCHQADVSIVISCVSAASTAQTEFNVRSMHKDLSRVVIAFDSYFASTQTASPKPSKPIKTL